MRQYAKVACGDKKKATGVPTTRIEERITIGLKKRMWRVVFIMTSVQIATESKQAAAATVLPLIASW